MNQMLSEEPDLELVRPQDTADQQVVGPIVTALRVRLRRLSDLAIRARLNLVDGGAPFPGPSPCNQVPGLAFSLLATACWTVA
jgi:hypothetical protein